MSEDIAMTVRPYGIPEPPRRTWKKAAILTDELNRLWEAKSTTKTRQIVTSCP